MAGPGIGCRLPLWRECVTLGKPLLFHLVGVIPGDEFDRELSAGNIPRGWKNECLSPEGEMWAHTAASTINTNLPGQLGGINAIKSNK